MGCIAEVVDELRYTERNIVTNLPIRVEPWVTADGEPRCGLRAFLRKTYKDEFDLDKRLVLLEEHEEEMPEFFAWRAPGVKVDVKRDDEGRAVEFDAEAAKRIASCLYLVDEAWKWFGARDWARTGKGVVWYGRQHRKFGDSVWYATQNADDLDKVLRGLCQGFVQVVNQGKLPMFGFRRPNAISWKEFGDFYISGVVFDHGIGRVFLSNGESYTAVDRELQLVDKHFVVINGKVYRWKRPDAPTGPVHPLVSTPAVPTKSGVVAGSRVIDFGR